MDRDFWESQGEEYSLQGGSQQSYSHYLWNEANQDEDSLVYMLGEQTPIKDCMGLGYIAPSTREHTNKDSEECGESSQIKRRRMLQYDSKVADCSIGDKRFPVLVQTKVVQGSLVDDILHGSMQGHLCTTGGNCSIGHECLDKSSQECLNNDHGEGRSSFHCNEMMISEGEIDISDYYNIPPEAKAEEEVPNVTTPLPRINFKGRRCIETPKKLVTSVAYPFALIKPSHIQGDTTLSEINQRIHTVPKPKCKNDDDPKLSYPTSAFTGKPVVFKTKIRTEGGKGSITIMRTKG